MNAMLLSPGTLSFVGDAVFGLYVRTKLSQINRPAGALHQLSVKLVSASAQSKAFGIIEPHLTEDELSVYKRGRNAHVNVPKSATSNEYHRATGLESLFGYLYLSDNSKRADSLFEIIWESFNDNLE